MLTPSFTISVVLTGLIAIVPNAGHDASFANIYLVKDAEHSPRLSVYGSVTLQKEQGGPDCTIRNDSEKGLVVDCDLTDTVVSLGGADDEGAPRTLPVKPGKEKPDPKSQSERQSKDWIVRMSNIESGIGQVKSPDDLDPYITSQMQLGWDTMESAELDGSEEGEDKIAGIGFKASNGSPSDLRQAVAEEIDFKTTITETPVIISVRNKKNNKYSVITAKCRFSNCFTMEVDNSASSYYECDATASIIEGLHFSRYYDLVKSAGNRMLPYSLDARDCSDNSAKIVDLQLLDTGLSLLEPVIPKVSRRIRDGFPDLEGKQRVFLTKAIDGLPVGTRKQKQFAEKLILRTMQVQNRVICPPVVLEP